MTPRFWNRSITGSRWDTWSAGRGPAKFALWTMVIGCLWVLLISLVARRWYPALLSGWVLAAIYFGNRAAGRRPPDSPNSAV